MNEANEAKTKKLPSPALVLALCGAVVGCSSAQKAPAAQPAAKAAATASSAPPAPATAGRPKYNCPAAKDTKIAFSSFEAREAAPAPRKGRPKPVEPTITDLKDVAWGPDDASLLIVTERGTSRGTKSSASILDLKSGAVRATLDGSSGARGRDLHFLSAEWSADGSLIALVRQDGFVLWEGRPNEQVRIVDAEPATETEDRQIAFSGRGSMFATRSSWSKDIRVFEGKSSKPKALVLASEGTNIEAHTFTFNADGTRLAVAAESAVSTGDRIPQVLLFDTTNGTLVRTLHAPMQRYQATRFASLYFTPQGRGLVAVDAAQGRIDLWNTASDDPPTTLIEETTVGASALVDGGNVILLGTTTLEMWDLRTRTRARELPGDGSAIEHLRASRSGDVVAVARGDHVDLFRRLDGARITIKSTLSGPLVYSDNGLFSGAQATLDQVRVKDASSSASVRALKPDEVSGNYRPSLVMDFLAGCALAPAK